MAKTELNPSARDYEGKFEPELADLEKRATAPNTPADFANQDQRDAAMRDNNEFGYTPDKKRQDLAQRESGDESTEAGKERSRVTDLTKRFGRQKQHTKSRKFLGKIEKRVAFAIVSVLASIAIAVAGFFAMLPLKLVHTVENLQDRFTSLSQDSIQKRSDKLFSSYVRKKVLPGLNGDCKTTRDRRCSFTGGDTSTPAGRLYKSWSDNKLETKLAEKYGLEFKYSKGQGPSARYSMLLNNAEVVKDFSVGEVDGFFDRDFNGRSDVRRAFREAIDNETKMKQIWLRFKYGKLLERKYGIRRCVFACKGRDSLDDWKQNKKNAFKSLLIKRVIEPKSEMAGLFFTCLAGLESDCENRSSEGQDGEKQSKFEKEFAEKMAAASEKMTAEQAEKVIKAANIIAEKGATQYAVEQIFSKVMSESSGKIAGKAVPIIGWIDLGVNMYSAVSGSAKIIKVAKYSSYATASVSLYMMYRSHADEIKSGNADAELIGQTVNTLGTIDTDQGMGTSPLQTELMGYRIADGGSMFSKSAYAIPVMQCEDGPIKNGALICPEESFKTDNQLISSIEEFKKSPIGQVFDSVSRVWKGTIGGIMNWAGDIFGTLIGKIPGVKALQDKLGEFTNKLAGLIMNKIIGSPVSDKMSGARTFNVMAGGASAAATEVANNGLGGKALSLQSYNDLMNEHYAQKRYEMSKKSLFARFFDTNDSDSGIAKVAVDMPGNLEGFKNSFIAYSLNPGSAVTQFANATVTNPTHAANAKGAWNANQAFGIKTIGVPLNDPAMTADPDELTEEFCKAENERWQNDTPPEGDPDTGYIYHYSVNRCKFEENVVGALGGKYDKSLLGKDGEEVGGTSQANISGGSSPEFTGNKQVSTDQMACAPGAEEEKVETIARPQNPLKLKLCRYPGFSFVNASWSPVIVKMIEAMKAEGVNFTGGGYRTYQEQIRLRVVNGCPDIYNAPASSCGTPTAPPGSSNHELGLAIDFHNCSVRSTLCHQWLKKYADPQIINLPSEAWHWSIDGR